MYVGFHQLTKRRIDGAMSGQRRKAYKGFTYDLHMEMSPPVTCPFMAGMLVAVIGNHQQ